MFFRTKQQIYNFTTREMARIEDEMRILDPKSEEYAILQRRYEDLLNIRRGNQDGSLLKVSEVVIAAIGTIVVPLTLAKISYDNDQHMNLCNSRIWNIIGRNTKTKI